MQRYLSPISFGFPFFANDYVTGVGNVFIIHSRAIFFFHVLLMMTSYNFQLG